SESDDAEIATSYLYNHSYSSDEESLSSTSSAPDEKVSHSLPFPLVPIPPTLSYAMIRKMLEEGLESDEVIGKNDTLSSSSALQQFSEQFAFVRKYYNIKVNEGPKRQCRILSDNLSLNFDDDLIYKFENGNEYLKTVRSKECNANLLHWAAYHGWIDIIDMLINDHGFDLVFTNTAGHTCVHYAVFGRKLETLKVLVTKHHCDPICKDSK
uniref:Uncharacterized protein n=1 Tax=Amphimedon queenslandica TaxID=400682 RepID=A0A1X7SFA7_AMPQE